MLWLSINAITYPTITLAGTANNVKTVVTRSDFQNRGSPPASNRLTLSKPTYSPGKGVPRMSYLWNTITAAAIIGPTVNHMKPIIQGARNR